LLRQAQFRRFHTSKYTLQCCGIEPVRALEQAREHGAVVGQNGIIAVLEQGRLLDFDLLAHDAAAVNATAQHPIDAAMAMVGATIAFLAERAAESGDHYDHRTAPGRRTDLLRESSQCAAGFAEPVGKIAVETPLVDVGVPAADVDEAEVELLS